MEGNVSGYVCNHGSPNGERDTASPRLWAMLWTQASDEEADDVFSRRFLYCGRTGNDVMGCRRPTGKKKKKKKKTEKCMRKFRP